MRELTMHELDAQLAEQLPARELMGHWGSYGHASFTYNLGSYDGNGNGNGFFNVLSGDLNGNLDGNDIYVL